MNDKGVVFISVLITMIVLFNLGLAYLFNGRIAIEISKNHRDAAAVFYKAESGLAHAIAEIKNGEDGNVPSQDLDADGVYDYSATYLNNEITGFGGDPLQGAYKTVKVNVIESPWIGAMQIDRSIIASVGNIGTINGNVDAGKDITMSGITVNGTITPNHRRLSIPSPSLDSYKTIANYTYNKSQTWTTNPAPGIHYITGNLIVSGISDFLLNGSIIVNGSVTFSSVSSSLTIAPAGKNPAIIAWSKLDISSSAAPNITGLVYARQDMTLSTITGPATFNGALVSKAGTLRMTNVNNFDLTFNPDINPPYFSGGSGVIRITSWKTQ